MKIKQAAPYRSVDFILTFTDPFQSVANTRFTFEPAKGGTKVTWLMDGAANSTIEKWMYLNMDGMLGKDFESGLKNLFFTGQLTVPGPGVPPSIISGQVVATEVEKYLKK